VIPPSDKLRALSDFRLNMSPPVGALAPDSDLATYIRLLEEAVDELEWRLYHVDAHWPGRTELLIAYAKCREQLSGREPNADHPYPAAV